MSSSFGVRVRGRSSGGLNSWQVRTEEASEVWGIVAVGGEG